MRTLVLMTACLVVVMSSLLVAQPPRKRNSPPDFFFVPLVKEIPDGESASPSRAVRAAQRMYSAPATSDMHFVAVDVPVLRTAYVPPASRPRPVGALKKAISSTIGLMKDRDAGLAGIFADEEAVDRAAKASGSEEALDYFSYDLPESPIEEVVAGTIPGTEDQHFVPVFTPILHAGYGPPASRRAPLGVVKQPTAAVEITEDGEPKSFPGLLADNDKVDNSDAMRGEFITSSGVKRVGYEEEAPKADKPKFGLKELEGNARTDSSESDLHQQKIKAVKYLGIMLTCCTGDDDSLAEALCAGLSDESSAIRKTTVEVIHANLVGKPNACLSSRGRKLVLDKLHAMDCKVDDSGKFKEPEAEIRKLAAEICEKCGPGSKQGDATGSPATGDQELANKVATTLDRANIRGSRIAVECRNGLVTLNGCCAADQVATSIAAAEGVPGVRQVTNRLRVDEKCAAQSAKQEASGKELPGGTSLSESATPANNGVCESDSGWVQFLAETVMDIAFGSIGGMSDCEPADFLFTTNDVQIIQWPSEHNSTSIQRIGVDFDFNIPGNEARADGQPPVRMDTLHNDPEAYVTAMMEHGVPVLNKVPYVSRLFKNTGVAHQLKFEANDDHAEHLLHAAGHLHSAAMPQDAMRIKNRALSIKVELLHQAYLDQFNQALGLREQVALLERNAKDAAVAARQQPVGLVTVFTAQPETRVNVLLHDKTVSNNNIPNIWDRVWGLDSGDGACASGGQKTHQTATYFGQKIEKQVPEFQFHTGRNIDDQPGPVVVFCLEPNTLNRNHAHACQSIARQVSDELKHNHVNVIDPDKVEAWISTNRNSKPAVVGEAFGAGYVIAIDLRSYDLYEEKSKSLYRGRSEVTAEVVMMNDGGTSNTIYMKNLHNKWPKTVGVSVDDYPHAVWEKMYLSVLSGQVSELFCATPKFIACSPDCCSTDMNVYQVAVTPTHAVRYHAIQTHARALSICANSNTTGRLIRSHTEESFAPASIPTPVDSTEAISAAAVGAVKAASHRSTTEKTPVIERANFLNLSAELTVRQNRGYDNRRVIHLSKKYFSAEEIIDLLTRHAEDSEFDVSPEALQEMKENGVNEAVIETMRKLAK